MAGRKLQHERPDEVSNRAAARKNIPPLTTFSSGI